VTHRAWLPALACLAAGMASAGTPRPQLLLTTESSPPSAMMEGKRITGFAAEKMRVVMQRSGIDYEMEMLPWKRAYVMAQSQANTCVFSTTRVPEREALFKWVGPTHENDWTLFGLAGRDYHIAKLSDAKKLRIGAYNGDVRGEYLAENGYSVDTVQDRLSNPRKLLLGRIDLWATSIRTGSAIAAQNGWKGRIVPVLTYKRTELFLACNTAVPDALVAKMNMALVAMNREGLSAAIERQFDYAASSMSQAGPASAR
jgi:polar amino acid transport system substrate-binding protein